MKTNCDNEVLESGVVSNGESDAELASLATALGHPARVAILRLLKEREVCICGEIVQQMPLAQSTVSQHLKVLKDAGWIAAREDGTRVCYAFNKKTLQQFGELLQRL